MRISKTWAVIAIISLVILGAITYLALTPRGNSMTTQPAAQPTQQTESPPPKQLPAATPGRYIAYNSNQSANTEGRVLLFFYASWCPQCRALDQSITKQGVPNNMTIFKVDYDTSGELKQRYGITLQTTVVEIDQQGELVKKFVAYDDPSLDAVLNDLGR